VLRFLCALVFLFTAVDGQSKRASSATSEDPIVVYVFLSESCPICQHYTNTLNTLNATFKNNNVLFVGLFPNIYSTDSSIAAFQQKYQLTFPLKKDENQHIATQFNAKITPEVVVVSGENKRIRYQGRIDDAFYEVGKKRGVLQSHTLHDALTALIHNNAITTPKTKAIGCVIRGT
jgi:peroxiredoxin